MLSRMGIPTRKFTIIRRSSQIGLIACSWFISYPYGVDLIDCSELSLTNLFREDCADLSLLVDFLLLLDWVLLDLGGSGRVGSDDSTSILCLRAHSAVLSSLRSGVRARGESTPLVSACDWMVGNPVICLHNICYKWAQTGDTGAIHV